MLKKWFAMKKKEIELKQNLYTCATAFLESKRDLAALIRNLYLALKDKSPEELENTLAAAIAEQVHQQTQETD